MSEKEKRIYTEDDIKHLDTISAIRLRPAMYIDGIGELGLYKIDSEAVQNCFDEYLIGVASYCKIDYNSVTGRMIVEDDGRGIPIGKLEQIFTQSHTGGKFDRNAYEISSGQNGIGAKCINALSTYCKIEVYREGYAKDGKIVQPQHGWIIFNNGRKVDEFVEDVPGSTKHGTKIEYITDDSILKTHERNVQKFYDYLNTTSYIDPGILIEYTVDGKKNIFHHTGGLDEFFKDFCKSKGLKPMIEPVKITGVDSDNIFSFDIMFAYGPNNSGDSNIISFVNGNRTPGHGVHVSSFRAGISLALTQAMQNGEFANKFPKGIDASGTLVSDNIIAIVGVRHRDPLFNGQTKEKLNSMDVQEPIKTISRNIFAKYLSDNPQALKKITLMALDYAKYEAERRKLKKTMIDSKQTKSIFDSNTIDPDKYKSCRSNNNKSKELFILEGNSAAGSVSKVRDSDFQATYSLRGKIFNVAKSGVSGHVSKEILDLSQISGLGIPINGKPKYENNVFDKYVIFTDADDDGAHIRTLLLAFFYTFYPKLIEEGHVYIANPPIKKLITSNGNHVNIVTEDDYDRLVEEYVINLFDLCSEKTNVKLSEGLFREFIRHMRGYNVLLDNHANSLSIDPRLLEMICVYINIVTQCTDNVNDKYNKEFYKLSHGYNIRFFRDKHIITFDKGVYHANLRFDDIFINEHFDPIVEKLNEIMIYGVYLHGKNSNHDYHGTLYTINKCMSGIFGPKIIIKRNKGVGEMVESDIIETVLNPATRQLTVVTMNEAAKAEKMMKIFMTDQYIELKRLFYSGKIEFN